jgi:nondiscriminating glutamyl-tRNA synthetase
LNWLSLNWDEGLFANAQNQKYIGEYGPYRQSDRTDIYKKYLQKLLDEKKAYYCYCSKEELEAEKQAMAAQGLSPKYSGHCRNLETAPASRKPQLIRFKMPESKIEFTDLIHGKISFDAALFGDIAIAKDLENPLYNFAVVIDDFEMKISHVIRGEDHISNTPKQILIQKALGIPTPKYAHLPLILSSDRSKMSKRLAETSFLEYREKGYLPEAMINFMALLGWHPQGDEEIFTIEKLIKEFDLGRVQKTSAIFNAEKLDWLNAHYIKNLDSETIFKRLKPRLKERGFDSDNDFIKKIIELNKERMKTLEDFFAVSEFFFKLPDYQPDLLIWKDNSASKTKLILEKISGALDNVASQDFNKIKLPFILEDLTNKEGKGNVLWPLRAALSGARTSPDPFSIMEILGKEKTLKRIKIAVNKLS